MEPIPDDNFKFPAQDKKRGQYTNFRCAGHWDCMHWTENLKTALGGVGEREQALHFLHQFHRPLTVGETREGRSTFLCSQKAT